VKISRAASIPSKIQKIKGDSIVTNLFLRKLFIAKVSHVIHLLATERASSSLSAVKSSIQFNTRNTIYLLLKIIVTVLHHVFIKNLVACEKIGIAFN
jgi:uncharacterized membrane protein